MKSTLQWAFAIAVIGLAGCADSGKPEPVQKHPGDDVLRDPMGYKPNMEAPNISGGGLLDYDKKAMKHDIDIFANP